MLRIACEAKELSCIIGHLFTELEPPCGGCNAERGITIQGTAFNGERVELILTEWGFYFNGSAELIEKIRKGVCLYERSAKPRQEAKRE